MLDLNEAALIEVARDMVSDDGENEEYDRAVVEMTTRLLGLEMSQARVVAAAVGVKGWGNERRFDY